MAAQRMHSGEKVGLLVVAIVVLAVAAVALMRNYNRTAEELQSRQTAASAIDTARIYCADTLRRLRAKDTDKSSKKIKSKTVRSRVERDMTLTPDEESNQ